MQAPDDTALAAAVDAPTRNPVARLLADWDRDNRYAHPLSDLSSVLDRVSVERAITGDLPAECSLVEGYTTATMTATLSGQRAGDPRDIARTLSPYRADSPLRQRSIVDVLVRLDLGLATDAGPRWVRQFTGSSRALRITAADRTVTLDALDPAERLRAAVTLPVAAESERVHRNPGLFPYRWRINTQWVLDYVLRRNSLFLSPPPRPGCLFAMTCHGGLIPDVGSRAIYGYMSKTGPDVPEFVPGVYGLAANGSSEIHQSSGGRAIDRFSIGDQAHLVEFHLHAGGVNTFHPDADGTIVAISTRTVKFEGTTLDVAINPDGRLVARVWSNPTSTPVLAGSFGGPRITGPAAWHSIGLWTSYDRTAATMTYRWRLDSAITAPATIPLTLDQLYSLPRPDVLVQTPVPVQCVQIAPAAAVPPEWGRPHTPQVDLDVGLNWMTGLPDVVNGDSWTVIKQAVAAEYGLVAFNEAGRFRFLNRDTARAVAAGPVVKTITAATSLLGLDTSVAVDSVRNQISHAAGPRLERDQRPEIVYQPSTVEELDAPWGTTKRTVGLSARCHADEAIHSYTPDSYEDYADYSGFVATDAATGAAVADVTVTALASEDESTVELTFSNPHQFPVRFQNDGRPAFRLVAYPISDDTPTRTLTTNPDSVARYGHRVLDLPDNPFRQTPDSAAVVAASLLADLADPVPILADVPVVGDPRVQLGDVIALADPDGLGGPITGTVIALRRALSGDDGLADRLTLRARPPT